MSQLLFFLFIFSFSNEDNSTDIDHIDQMDDDQIDNDMDFQHLRDRLCGPNTTSVNGECVCLPEFPSGDPYSSDGCYVCLENCSEFAYCAFPGVCKCNSDMGNGTYCYSNYITANSIKELPHNIIAVGIQFDSDSQLQTAFCRFGDIIVQGQNVTNDLFYCEVPRDMIPNCPFSVSIDTSSWSDPLIFDVKGNTEKLPKSKTGLSIIFIFSMVILSILMFNTKAPQKSESQPFIKEKPKPGEPFDEDDMPQALPIIEPYDNNDINANDNIIFPNTGAETIMDNETPTAQINNIP